jgi:hypothetical protein
MPVQFWNSTRSAFASIDCAYDWGLNILSDDDKGLRAIAKADQLPKTLSDAYESLSKMLNTPIQNAGLVVYSADGNLVFYGHPAVGLKSNVPTLMIGADSGEEFQSVCLPLTLDESGDYTISGSKVTLERIKNGDQETPFVKLRKKGETFEHLFPLRLPKDTNLDVVVKAFDDGEFGSVLNSFSQVYASATKMFKTSFEKGLFPQSGVMFVLTNGRITNTDWQGSTITSATFQILACSHPDLEVKSSKKDDDEMYPLSEIGSISFSSSSQAYTMLNEGSAKSTDILYLHFQAPAESKGQQRYDWTPKHVATVRPERLRGVSAVLYNQMKVGGLLPAVTEKPQLPASEPTKSAAVPTDAKPAAEAKPVAAAATVKSKAESVKGDLPF